MERSLLWSALAIGFLGWLYCLLATDTRPAPASARREPVVSSLLILAVALTVFVFCITLPESPPFASGHGFGRGFLLGSIGALLAMLVIWRGASTSGSTLPSLLSSQFLAVVVVALPLIFLRATIIDTLLGVACGWLAVTIVLLQGTITPASVAAGASGAGFAIALCAISALGVYRDFLTPEIARGTWSSVAVAFATGVPISVLLAGQIRERVFGNAASAKAITICTFCAASILLLLANLLALKILAQPRFSLVVAFGLLTGCVVWWAARAEESSRSENANAPEADRSTPVVPIGAFALLAAVVLSFGLLQGFGVGLMILAAWPATCLALLNEDAPGTPEAVTLVVRLLQPLFFGVILLLERLFEQRFRADLRGVAITDYYALLGFLIGAALPALLADGLRGANHRATTTLWLRLLFVGAAILSTPFVLMILWGVKTSFALLFGLSLACLLSRDAVRMISLHASLLAIAVALLLTQWTHRLLPLAEMTRGERLRALGFVVIMLLILIVVSDLFTRLRNRKANPVSVVAS